MEQQAFTEDDITIINTGNGDRCLGVIWELPEEGPNSIDDYPSPPVGFLLEEGHFN